MDIIIRPCSDLNQTVLDIENSPNRKGIELSDSSNTAEALVKHQRGTV